MFLWSLIMDVKRIGQKIQTNDKIFKLLYLLFITEYIYPNIILYPSLNT